MNFFSFIDLIASPIKVPTFKFFSISACLWIPITVNEFNNIIGEPDEPCSVGILW